MSDVIRINKQLKEFLDEFRKMKVEEADSEFHKQVYSNMTDTEMLTCMGSFAVWGYKKYML